MRREDIILETSLASSVVDVNNPYAKGRTTVGREQP